jgi:hypothetical protein
LRTAPAPVGVGSSTRIPSETARVPADDTPRPRPGGKRAPALDRLEARPLTTVVVLRILFFVGAPLNFALALSPLRPRDYVMGSVIGLLPPTFVLAAFFDLLFGGA